MKKIAILLLLFMYSFATVGTTVHFHYCMNNLVGWDYNKQENKKCGKCGMTEAKTKKGCCKDEAKQLKLDTDHQKSIISHDFDFIQTPAIIANFDNYQNIFYSYSKVKNTIARPPPIKALQDFNILYCVFRI